MRAKPYSPTVSVSVPDAFAEVVNDMRKPVAEGGVEVRDRHYLLKKYPSCFGRSPVEGRSEMRNVTLQYTILWQKPHTHTHTHTHTDRQTYTYTHTHTHMYAYIDTYTAYTHNSYLVSLSLSLSLLHAHTHTCVRAYLFHSSISLCHRSRTTLSASVVIRTLANLVASSLVSWLISKEAVRTREEAVCFCQRLQQLGVFEHVVDSKAFVDGNFFYRFQTLK
jgi:Domain found in Dishevelled, Egl-10, and Pleckstrin (DEP)